MSVWRRSPAVPSVVAQWVSANGSVMAPRRRWGGSRTSALAIHWSACWRGQSGPWRSSTPAAMGSVTSAAIRSQPADFGLCPMPCSHAVRGISTAPVGSRRHYGLSGEEKGGCASCAETDRRLRRRRVHCCDGACSSSEPRSTDMRWARPSSRRWPAYSPRQRWLCCCSIGSQAQEARDWAFVRHTVGQRMAAAMVDVMRLAGTRWSDVGLHGEPGAPRGVCPVGRDPSRRSAKPARRSGHPCGAE